MSKLPEIGKRYKQINNGKCVKVRGYSMTDYNPVLVYYSYLEDEEHYGYNFDMFLKEFEELPDQEPTINHIVDANKKEVYEAFLVNALNALEEQKEEAELGELNAMIKKDWLKPKTGIIESINKQSINKLKIRRIAKEIKEKIRSDNLYGFAYISLLIDTVDEYFLGAKQSLKDDITMKILDILEEDGITQLNF